MHLYERGEGVFGTHVHIDDVIDVLSALSSDKTKPKLIGEPKCIGEMNGFASRIVLLHLDWNDDVDENLPKDVVLKIPTMLQYVEGLEQIKKEGKIKETAKQEDMHDIEHIYRRIHSSEIDFYSRISQFQKPNLRILKFYGGVKFSETNTDKGFLLLEYCPDLVPIHSTDSADENLMDQILRSFAALNSINGLFTEEVLSEKRNYFGDLFKPMLPPNMKEKLLSILSNFVNDEQVISDVDRAVTKMSTDEFIAQLDAIPEELGIKRVPIHADGWHCNMLFTKDAMDQLQLRALIDFQTLHNGNVGCELAKLLCAMLNAEDRREKSKVYLRKYMDYLTVETDGQPPFTLEQLEESVGRCLPLIAYLTASSAAALIDIVLLRKPEHLRSEIRAQVLENVRTLLTDTISVLGQ